MERRGSFSLARTPSLLTPVPPSEDVLLRPRRPVTAVSQRKVFLPPQQQQEQQQQKEIPLLPPASSERRILPHFVVPLDIQSMDLASAERRASLLKKKRSELSTPNLNSIAAASSVAPSKLSCKAWCLLSDKGYVLAGSQGSLQRSPASLTKMMTAFLVIQLVEKHPALLQHKLAVSRRAARCGGTSADLAAGDELTVRDLLYGLMLPSGNDAALVFAENLGHFFSSTSTSTSTSSLPTLPAASPPNSPPKLEKSKKKSSKSLKKKKKLPKKKSLLYNNPPPSPRPLVLPLWGNQQQQQKMRERQLWNENSDQVFAEENNIDDGKRGGGNSQQQQQQQQQQPSLLFRKREGLSIFNESNNNNNNNNNNGNNNNENNNEKKNLSTLLRLQSLRSCSTMDNRPSSQRLPTRATTSVDKENDAAFLRIQQQKQQQQQSRMNQQQNEAKEEEVEEEEEGEQTPVLVVDEESAALLKLRKERETNVSMWVKEMNRQAASFGMANTNFVNPHGLSTRFHVSTAKDMALLAHRAMQNSRFRSVVGTRSYNCTVQNAWREEERGMNWENTNKLLGTPDYDGVKTGVTPSAGYCLASRSTRGGESLILVTLGSSDSNSRYVDTQVLLRWGWRMLGNLKRND